MGHGFKLTQLQVDRYKVKGVYGDGAGLSLNVTAGGSKSWLFRYMVTGKAHWMGLGSYPDVSLAEAREIAAECRKMIREGKDPLAEKRLRLNILRAAIAKTITFQTAAEQYIADNKAGWRNINHLKQWQGSLANYVYPKIGNLDVALIETPHVLSVIKPLWQEKTETASRIRGRIEIVLDWAKAHQYRTGENPARWKGHLEAILPRPSKVKKAGHYPALSWREVGEFMQELRKVEGIAARVLEFAILTSSRSAEVREATWNEFNLETAVWTVPGSRMKADSEHTVPLTKRALGILGQMRSLKAEDSEMVFPGAKKGRPIGNSGIGYLIKSMDAERRKAGNCGWIDPKTGEVATLHGFRSTFRDWVSEVTNFPGEMAEFQLAHTLDSKTEAAYRRGSMFDKRRRMMQAWCDFCEKGNDNGQVIPMTHRQNS